MNVLVDTHALLWAAFAPGNLSPAAMQCMADESNSMLVSVVSAYEIANKVRRGKLPEAELLSQDFISSVTGAGFQILPLSAEVALLAGRLAGTHRDPWDRIIASQAIALNIPVLSIDSKLDAFGARRIW